MATLDEIFAAMPDAPAGGTHELLIIDPDTRQIYVPDIESIFGVVKDGNAEKKYFQCPRYVGKGIDLAACKLRVAFQNASGTEEGRDGYLVQDLTESGGYVYFSWELSEKVCLFQGAVQFAVCAMQGTAVVWNTTIATGTVLDGLTYNGEIVQTEMQDVIAQLLDLVEAQSKAVEAAGAAQVQNVQAARAAALVEINAAAANAAPAIVCEAEGAAIHVADASNRPLQGLRIFGRSTQDGTPTPEAPVEIVSTPAPAVTVCGKNLFDLESFLEQPSADVTGYTKYDLKFLLPHTTYTFTAIENNYFGSGAYLLITDDLTFKGMTNADCIYYWIGHSTNAENCHNLLTFTTGEKPMYLAFGAKSIGTMPQYLTGIQFELGDTATEYEPYTGKTLTVANALPGIPVASGGNYTDADGQQWTCDEVDLARGVYVRRVALDTLTTATYYASGSLYCKLTSGTAKEDLICICSHTQKGIAFGNGAVGAYTSCVLGPSVLPDSVTDKATGQAWLEQQVSSGKPVTVGYILTTPVETPLTEAELAAFAALHSVKPTTTILNDSGAHMAVEYVADTKLYIDRKLAELIANN